MRSSVAWCVLVVLAVAAVFAFGVTSGHLSMDDWGYVYGCFYVKDGLSARNALDAFRVVGYDAFWMPLTYLSYMADISVFGGSVAEPVWKAHHAVNVCLHAVNALLVLALVRAVLASLADRIPADAALKGAAVAALLWALHPMRAESVTYVASRKELLWSLFALLGLLAWLRHLASRGRGSYCAAFACCVLACLSKPTAVCFPALAFLLELVLTGRSRAVRIRSYLPFLALSVAVGAVAMYAQSHPIGNVGLNIFGESLGWRLLNAAVALGMYVYHTLVPGSAYFDYRAVFGGEPLDLVLGLSVLSLAALAVVGTLVRTRRADVRRMAVLSVCWFGLALAPVLGVFGTVNGDHAYADRYSYLPSVAIAMLLAWGLALAFAKMRHHALLHVTVLSALAVEIACAVPVIRSFRDDYTAFSRTLEKDPDHWRALRVVGTERFARSGAMDEGIGMVERSLRLHPTEVTLSRLSLMRAQRGAPDDFEAVDRFEKAIERNRGLAKQDMLLHAVGLAAFKRGQYVKAVLYLEESLDVDRKKRQEGSCDVYSRADREELLREAGRRANR